MKFIYRAKDKNGNLKAGTVEARSLKTAVEILQSYGLVVLEITPQKKIGFLDKLFGKKTRISRKDLAVFLRQFSILLASQVPLSEALKTLLFQAATPAVKDLVSGLVSDLDAGLPLSQAVEKRGDIFGEFYSQMIKSGEISGRLQEVLSYLADYAEHENDLVSKAKAGATYPVFLFASFLVIGTIITTVLAPQMVNIFAEFGQRPPLGTRILITTGNFLNHWGILVGVILVGLIWMALNYFHSAEGRRMGGIYILSLPIIGDVYRKIYIARFCETAGTLMQGGIPVVTAFEVAGDATGNYIYQKIGHEVAESIKSGASLSSILKKNYKYFPPLVGQMAAVGEGTGRLDSVLKRVASYYQKEIDRSFNTMLNLLQPILIIIIGVFVAFLVAAVLLPIYQLAQGV